MFKKFLIILAIIFISSCQIKENLEEENFFVVIPHHNLVRKDIDEFYSFLSQKYSDKNIENIVVISPNHFNFNGLLAETIPENGALCFGKTCLQAYTFDSIENKTHFFAPVFKPSLLTPLLSKGEGKYKTSEHGIGEQMLHISKYFPNAKFYPLVININHKNVKNSAEKIEEIIISSNINGNTLFIASVDFSHNAPENIAIQRDEETLKKMQEGDLQDAEIDCPNCLQTLYFLANDSGKTCFNKYKRTSSDLALGTDTGEENTSHIYGEYETCK